MKQLTPLLEIHPVPFLTSHRSHVTTKHSYIYKYSLRSLAIVLALLRIFVNFIDSNLIFMLLFLLFLRNLLKQKMSIFPLSTSSWTHSFLLLGMEPPSCSICHSLESSPLSTEHLLSYSTSKTLRPDSISQQSYNRTYFTSLSFTNIFNIQVSLMIYNELTLDYIALKQLRSVDEEKRKKGRVKKFYFKCWRAFFIRFMFVIVYYTYFNIRFSSSRWIIFLILFLRNIIKNKNKKM